MIALNITVFYATKLSYELTVIVHMSLVLLFELTKQYVKKV